MSRAGKTTILDLASLPPACRRTLASLGLSLDIARIALHYDQSLNMQLTDGTRLALAPDGQLWGYNASGPYKIEPKRQTHDESASLKVH